MKRAGIVDQEPRGVIVAVRIPAATICRQHLESTNVRCQRGARRSVTDALAIFASLETQLPGRNSPASPLAASPDELLEGWIIDGVECDHFVSDRLEQPGAAEPCQVRGSGAFVCFETKRLQL